MRQTILSQPLAIPLMAMALVIASCNSQHVIVPKLKFGQKESDWRQIQKDLVSDGVFRPRLSSSFDRDTFYLFNWVLEDTSYVMRVYLNGDADHEGSLRMYSMRLTKDTFPNSPSSGEIKEESSNFSFYMPSTIKDLRQRIDSRFGKPDSVSTSNDDSSFWYKKDGYNLELKVPNPLITTEGPVYNPIHVFVYSKTYKADYEKFLTERRSILTPSDLFRVDFNAPKLSTQGDLYGLQAPVLKITSLIESSPSFLNEKNIASTKGSLRILDKYNDVLLELADQEYILSSPLCCGRSWIIQNGNFGLNLSLANKPQAQRLIEAINRGSTLKVEYEPKIILYTDGTVFR